MKHIDEIEEFNAEAFERMSELLKKRLPSDAFACNSLESLLYRQFNRQARRQFMRLLERHWPVKPDAKRHPRLTEFLKRYEAAQSERLALLSSNLEPRQSELEYRSKPDALLQYVDDGEEG